MTNGESEQAIKTCPDCSREYIGLPEDDCCAECFDGFSGMTIEEIIGLPPKSGE